MNMQMGLHWWDAIFVVTTFIPIIIGFFWMWGDANLRRQPGWMWALLTIPFGWFTVIAYLVVRTLAPPAR